MTDRVDELLAAHGFRGPWTQLTATGVANRIYATADVVVRVATDHPEATPDARTESVAAPTAWAAGIRTPHLLAFDDSRALVDRPFSIWERIHGETLGNAHLDTRRQARVWHEVGQELATLHDRVRDCPDPHRYLDTPGYELNLEPILARLVDAGGASRDLVRDIGHLISELTPHMRAARPGRRFVHNDMHGMNVMCTRAGGLLALIDWGDAGWGDPALDFVAMPLEMMPAAFEGYGAANLDRLGSFPIARIVWARLHHAMRKAIDAPGRPVPLASFRRALETS